MSEGARAMQWTTRGDQGLRLWAVCFEIGREWSTMAENGREWSGMVENGREWSTMVDNGQAWSRVTVVKHGLGRKPAGPPAHAASESWVRVVRGAWRNGTRCQGCSTGRGTACSGDKESAQQGGILKSASNATHRNFGNAGIAEVAEISPLRSCHARAGSNSASCFLRPWGGRGRRRPRLQPCPSWDRAPCTPLPIFP